MSQQAIWNEASRTASLPEVDVRIRRLVEEREAVAQYDGERIRWFVIQNLQDLASNAKRDSDKIRANELLGKLTSVGAFTERSETTVVDDRSAADVEAELKETLVSLLGADN